ncbi:MAG: NupC/NupG family nucleoside CNT transporter [Hyphomonadaceae bacterium]|nr:NupC/NupG family nucleoside CNT transporter [Hyphomonadaceae bacterium]
MNHPAFGIIGVIVILLIAWTTSTNRRAIRLRTVIPSFLLQIALAGCVFHTNFGMSVLQSISDAVQGLLIYADAGIEMVFGSLTPDRTANEFSFLVLVLPVIVFFAALMEVLYHLNIMQIVVKTGGRFMRFVTDTKPVESLNAVANIFIGQTEAPLSLKPYLPSLSRAELFTLMVSGLASIAGSVLLGYIAIGISPEYLVAACFMSAPAALLMAKIIMPDSPGTDEDNASDSTDVYALGEGRKHRNVIMAAAMGAQGGVTLAVNIGAMVFAFVALIALLNGILGWVGGAFGVETLSMQSVLGWLFAPIMFLLNVPWSEAAQAGSIFGEKVVLNEFIAYLSLVDIQDDLSPRTVVILTFALCGFANFGSIAILLGGLGTLIPDRMNDIADMGLRALFAASLANLLNAAIAGIMFGGV